RGDRLDQDRRLDRAVRYPDLLLREREHLVPQPRLEVRLHLRQVEVGPGAPLEQALRVAEEVQAEVEQRARNALLVHQQVLVRQVPSARTDEEGGGLLVQRVRLAVLLERDRALDRVGQVQ